MKKTNFRISYEEISPSDGTQRIARVFDLIFSKIPHKGCDCGWTSVGEILPGRAKEIIQRCQKQTAKEGKDERNI